MQDQAGLPEETFDESVRNFDPKDRIGLISLFTAAASVIYTLVRPLETQDDLMSLTVVFSVISIFNAKSIVPRVSLGIVIAQFLLVQALLHIG
ncbi:MAG: hypothetical protein B7Z39_01635 [Novosphingobium sp. 12-64-8]|nr:MAG: hypothetical protein B7Z39_01635 [Novosphingobium sp. 12-64-8]